MELELRNIGKSFGDKQVLTGVSFLKPQAGKALACWVGTEPEKLQPFVFL